jgi:hypothetical protein
MPSKPTTPHIYQLKITLLEIDPPIWGNVRGSVESNDSRVIRSMWVNNRVAGVHPATIEFPSRVFGLPVRAISLVPGINNFTLHYRHLARRTPTVVDNTRKTLIIS